MELVPAVLETRCLILLPAAPGGSFLKMFRQG